MKLRSSEWFENENAELTFQHRSAMRAMGHNPESFVGKPIIGIFNTWSDFNSCNYPHRELVEHVKRGVLLAGGYPIELHTITTPADFMKPSDLMYRNLLSMDLEESIRSQPIDGVVLLCECDKTVPGQLMGAASCDLPALQLAAGHRSSGSFRGKTVNYGTDLWKYSDDYKAGLLSEEEWRELERSISCSLGGCPVMGTASTMKSLSEMLGMMLPGTSSIPATHASRKIAAEATGKRIVEMVRTGLTPSRLMTEAAFHNAIKLLAAIGGSTNAALHLTAIAGRLGIRIPIERYAELTEDVPLIVNLQPSGSHSMDDFYKAGGLRRVIRNLLPLLDTSCLSCTGETIGATYGGDAPGEAAGEEDDVIAALEAPFKKQSGLAVLKGNLAPGGAVVKKSAVSPELFRHRGRAVVFEDYADMLARIDSEELDVAPESVLVLKNCGPVAIGMPEWGSIPIPQKLLRQGVRDMVRISDARMSGTSYGAVVLHVAPEAAVGGPLAVVRDGDWIELDIERSTLRLELDDAELASRMAEWRRPEPRHKRGYPRLFAEHALQAPEGCDLDILRPETKADAAFVPPVVGRG
ncbi:dihydroxy-acid dehydratase [Paenibacillus flagellatus]|uniref:Dihydroxy-acid dehydratase n=1 Tax=Paenibacillus flagellatus TaxID=2211139 RepID=A0A2V5K1P5_9BACL|nr:dihydroxy-acid dehydratase [Paenibacillus flagellatus]PYI53099.1 dihydroxy-acid dehydratase [Paenibacillus flagellatus]